MTLKDTTAKISPRLFQLNRHRIKHLVLVASLEVHTAKSTSISRKQEECNSPQKDPYHNLALHRSSEVKHRFSIQLYEDQRKSETILFILNLKNKVVI